MDRSPQRDERGFICWTLLMGLVALVVALSARCYRRDARRLDSDEPRQASDSHQPHS